MKKTRKEIFEDYEGFVEKFKPKKTTDDCYTPPAVYQCVLDWVNEKIMPLEGVEVVRPFWPGGDFEAYDYPPGAVVIDNPPFSILAKIRRFFAGRGIKYFLFGPGLTLFNSARELTDSTFIVTGTSIIYENGADIPAGFVTNMLGGDPKIMVSGDLTKRLERAQVTPSKSKRKIIYPLHLVSAPTLRRIATRGVNFNISAADCIVRNKFDNFRRAVFGGGFLLSDKAAAERAAAERAAAERAAAERAAAERAALSDRELKIIEELSHGRRGADDSGHS